METFTGSQTRKCQERRSWDQDEDSKFGVRDHHLKPGLNLTQEIQWVFLKQIMGQYLKTIAHRGYWISPDRREHANTRYKLNLDSHSLIQKKHADWNIEWKDVYKHNMLPLAIRVLVHQTVSKCICGIFLLITLLIIIEAKSYKY